MDKERIIKAIAVANKVCGGGDIGKDILLFMLEKLSRYKDEQVIAALDLCTEERRGQLALKDIIERIAFNDGWLSPDEAWALCPFNENQTVVWYQEIAESFETVRAMKDRIAGRVAFRETYQKAVSKARSDGREPDWSESLGNDYSGREAPLREAASKGRISQDRVRALLRPPEEEALARDAKKLASGRVYREPQQMQFQRCGSCGFFWEGLQSCPECGASNPSNTWKIEG